MPTTVTCVEQLLPMPAGAQTRDAIWHDGQLAALPSGDGVRLEAVNSSGTTVGSLEGKAGYPATQVAGYSRYRTCRA